MKKKVKSFFASLLSVYAGFIVFMFVVSWFAQCAGASDLYGRYGLGVFNSAKDSFSEVKTIGFGVQKELLLPVFIQQYEAGFWTDTRRDIGRGGAGYVSGSVGLHIDADHQFAQALWGIALLSGTDSMLGGIPQFKQDLVLGLKDGFGCSIGLVYTHMSSAGVFLPNIGRDFLTLRLSIPIL